VPAAHDEQLADPILEEYVPASQLKQLKENKDEEANWPVVHVEMGHAYEVGAHDDGAV